MLQGRSRQWIRVVFAVVALIALGLATVALLNGTIAVSEAQGGDIPLERGRRADAERLTAAADFYLTGGRSRARAAEAERLTALAGRQAQSDRLSAQAAHYLGSSSLWRPVRYRGRMGDSARLTAAARRLGAEPIAISPALACAILP